MRRAGLSILIGISVLSIIAVGCGENKRNNNQRGRVSVPRKPSQPGTPAGDLNGVAARPQGGKLDGEQLDAGSVETTSAEAIDRMLSSRLNEAKSLKIDEIPIGQYRLEEVFVVEKANGNQQVDAHRFSVGQDGNGNPTLSSARFYSTRKSQSVNSAALEFNLPMVIEVQSKQMLVPKALTYARQVTAGKSLLSVRDGDATKGHVVASLMEAAVSARAGTATVYSVPTAANSKHELIIKGHQDQLFVLEDFVQNHSQKALSRALHKVLVYRRQAQAAVAAPATVEAGSATPSSAPAVAPAADAGPSVSALPAVSQ